MNETAKGPPTAHTAVKV